MAGNSVLHLSIAEPLPIKVKEDSPLALADPSYSMCEPGASLSRSTVSRSAVRREEAVGEADRQARAALRRAGPRSPF